MTTSRLTLLTDMLKQDPDDTFVLFAVAKEYEKLDDTASAILYYEKLKAVDSKYVGLYYHLGQILEKTDEIEKAQVIFKEGIAVATEIKDQHALSELKGVLMNLEIEYGLDD